MFQTDNHDEATNTTTTTTTTTTRKRHGTRHLSSQHRSYSESSIEHSESANQLLSSPRQRTHRSRSNSRRRWVKTKRHSSPPSPTEENRKTSFESMEAEQSTTQLVGTRRSRERKTVSPQITSANSIVLVHPQEQTIAVIENPYEKDGTIVKQQHLKSLRRIRREQITV